MMIAKHLRNFVIVLAIALAGTTSAWSQCSGQFQPGRFCGNGTGALGLPGPTLITPSVFQPIAGGTVLGNPTGAAAVPVATATPVLGVPGSVQGSLGIAASGGGTVSVRVPTAAGTYNFNLPAAAGSAGQILQSGGGAAAPMTFSTATYPATTTINQLLYSSANNIVAGLATVNGGLLNAGATGVPTVTVTPVLGVPGASQGTLGLAGVSGGTATITAQATAGTPTLTLPNTSGTFAAGATGPLVLNAATGVLTCPTCATSSGGGAITGTAPISVSGAGVVSLNANGVTYAFLQQVPALSLVGNGTGTLANAQSLAGTANQVARVNGAGTAMGFGSIDLAQSAAVGSSLLPLANGGLNAALTASNGGILWSDATKGNILAGTATARLPLLSGSAAAPVWGAFTLPASVTSGGVAYFSSTGAMASSAALGGSQIVVGGGVGGSPATIGSLGTTSTVLHGNAAGPPSFGQVVTADVANNAIGNAQIAQAGAYTLKGNFSGSTANLTDATFGSLNQKVTPAAGDYILLADNAASGQIKYALAGSLSSIGSVGSIGGMTGNILCGSEINCFSQTISAVSGNVKSYGASGSSATTTGTMSAASTSITLASALDFRNGDGIIVNRAGAVPTVGVPTPTAFLAVNGTGSTTYNYCLASVDSQGGISNSSCAGFSNGVATLGTYTGGLIQLNSLTWSVGSGSPLCTAVWRQIGAGSMNLLGCFLGTNMLDTGLPTKSIFYVPTTQTIAAQNRWLATTIASGSGTTTLTLAAPSVAAVTSQVVNHDDTLAFVAAAAANSKVYAPTGDYYLRGLDLPSSVRLLYGDGRGNTNLRPITVSSAGLNAGVTMSAGGNSVTVDNINVAPLADMAYDGLTINNSNSAQVTRSNFQGHTALRFLSSGKPSAIGNTVSGFWNVGISCDTCSDEKIQGNTIGPITGQAGAVGTTSTPAGNGQPWSSGVLIINGTLSGNITGNVVELFGGNFGISNQSSGRLVGNNSIRYTGRECMVSIMPSKVDGNDCFWNPAGNGNTSSYDLGTSISDNGSVSTSGGDVTANTYKNSGLSAISIYGSGGAATLQNVSVVANTVDSPNQIGFSCGITLAGSNQSKAYIGPNVFMNPNSTNTLFNVCEQNVGFGAPAGSNRIAVQIGEYGSTGMVKILSSTTYYQTQPTFVFGPNQY